MMISQRILPIFILITIFIVGCVSSEQSTRPDPQATPPKSRPTKSAIGPAQKEPAAPQTDASTSAPPAEAAKAEKPAITPDIDHRAPYDSVDWESLTRGESVPQTAVGEREWHGERLGLMGPIVAHSSTGGRYRFVLVYDSAGILVGAMTRKEFKKDPEKFEALLKKAHARSQHQSRMALQYMIRRQHIEQAIDAPPVPNQ